MIKELINYVNDISTFTFDGEDDGIISFRTRENGNVGDEEYGVEDLKEAIQIAKKVKEKFPNVYIEVETVDEWVEMQFFINGRPKGKVEYCFKKDCDGSGFTQGFKSMEDLIKEFKNFIKCPIDWVDVTKKIDAKDNNKIMIADRTISGWGYDFFIIKETEKYSPWCLYSF